MTKSMFDLSKAEADFREDVFILLVYFSMGGHSYDDEAQTMINKINSNIPSDITSEKWCRRKK